MTEIQKYRNWQIFKWLGWALFIIMLFFHTCSNSEKPIKSIKVIIPELKGTFKPQKPKHTNLTNNVKQKSNNENEFLQSEIDKLLNESANRENEFAKLSDSLQKKEFAKAIEQKSFYSLFEDKNIKIDISGIVTGDVKSITPTYTIKEKEVIAPVKIKERVFALKSGFEIGNNLEFNKPLAKVNLIFENKKGNQYTLGADTQEQFYIGYTFKIFEIKK